MIDASFLGKLVRRSLDAGLPVEIDGLGSFRRGEDGSIRYEPSAAKRVFLAYASEDRPEVERLFDDLKAAGFDPWMDCRKLMPGQNWPRAIDKAIAVSDFFLPCLSTRSVEKRGRFQAEMRYALECAEEVPLDRAYLVPVRLNECKVPERLDEYQWVDLFPDRRSGVGRLIHALQSGRREG
jgi:hypothetical protein